MAIGTAKATKFTNFAELIHDLGDISPRRIRLNPPPGRATIDDLIRINARQDRIYELVDGTLVEKGMGATESLVATEIIFLLATFVKPRKLGFVLNPDGTLRIMPGLVRAPDVSFIRRAKCPGGKFPRSAVPDLVPDLAIEVLSRSNRAGEMRRKLKEYFLSGVTAVWFIDPANETAEIFAAPDRSTKLAKNQTIDGGDLLPGFRLPLADLFADLADGPAHPKRNGKRKKS